MLKSLFPPIVWEEIEAVGFDLDGTLYDELDFILQVYLPITALLAEVTKWNQHDLYGWMINRWLEKGSSYNKIFLEVLDQKNIDEETKVNIIENCLNIYRGFQPNLYLTNRVKILLDIFKKNYPIFLITDGNSRLQKAKINALGLERWFENKNIVISGDYEHKHQKPSSFMAGQIEILKKVDFSRAVYFGDRKQDELFAQKLGFKFIQVKVMQVVELNE